jgi:hypothetical protein
MIAFRFQHLTTITTGCNNCLAAWGPSGATPRVQDAVEKTEFNVILVNERGNRSPCGPGPGEWPRDAWWSIERARASVYPNLGDGYRVRNTFRFAPDNIGGPLFALRLLPVDLGQQ